MPRWNTAAVRSRTLARLRDERGIALIMALGILFVLTITLGTVIYVTSASARHAEHSNAGQKAYALAEAGVNNALAVLNANYPPEPSTTSRPATCSHCNAPLGRRQRTWRGVYCMVTGSARGGGRRLLSPLPTTRCGESRLREPSCLRA